MKRGNGRKKEGTVLAKYFAGWAMLELPRLGLDTGEVARVEAAVAMCDPAVGSRAALQWRAGGDRVG